MDQPRQRHSTEQIRKGQRRNEVPDPDVVGKNRVSRAQHRGRQQQEELRQDRDGLAVHYQEESEAGQNDASYRLLQKISDGKVAAEPVRHLAAHIDQVVRIMVGIDLLQSGRVERGSAGGEIESLNDHHRHQAHGQEGAGA